VSPKACPPQKTDMHDPLDLYLSGFYLCGMTLAAVAERCSVTPDAVEKALKRYDREAYLMERSRRKEENAQKRRQKDRERKRVAEAREKERLRKKKEREEENTYVAAVRKFLQDSGVVALLRRAALELSAAWEQRACTRYIPETPSIRHPCPGQARESVELMTPGEAGGRAEYEYRLIRGGMVGVPGPAVLQIRPALDCGKIGLAYQLARDAVLRAGFVNPHARVRDVIKGVTRTYRPGEMEALRVFLVLSAQVMANVPDPPPLMELSRKEKEKYVRRWLADAKAAERKARVEKGAAGTGKRGRGGGMRSVSQGVKISAVTRI